jgi:D-arabinose 1-dehydrogenase-like Zn-dependent alcohol dehydrogenase
VGDTDLLVKSAAAGFCHTDYQVWEGVYESPTPIVPSHEPVGTIVAVGSKVQDRWKVGQRVGALLFRHQCHTCLGCKVNNDIRFCENIDFAGLKADGAMAEYFIADGNNSVLIPDEVDFMDGAPLMCAGVSVDGTSRRTGLWRDTDLMSLQATTWAALDAAGLKPGEPIGIVGIGGLGSLAVQFAKARGHPVVAVDNREEGRALAQETPLKADLVVDFNDKGATDKIKKWAGNGGLPGLLVTTDNNDATNWALSTLRPHGVCVPLGLPVPNVQFDSFALVFQELVIKGSVVSTKEQAAAMMKTVAEHGIRSHITAIPLEKVPEVLPGAYMDPHLKGRLVVKIS